MNTHTEPHDTHAQQRAPRLVAVVRSAGATKLGHTHTHTPREQHQGKDIDERAHTNTRHTHSTTSDMFRRRC